MWRYDWSSQFWKQLKKLWIKAWKIQAWTGFEPMNSVLPVQCIINWAIKPTGSWPFCEFVIYPWKANNAIIAHLAEHCTGVARVRISNPAQAGIFSGFNSTKLSCVYNCGDQSCLHTFLRSSDVWYSVSYIDLYCTMIYSLPRLSLKQPSKRDFPGGHTRWSTVTVKQTAIKLVIISYSLIC